MANRVRINVIFAGAVAFTGIARAQSGPIPTAALDSAAAIVELRSACGVANVPGATGLLDGVVRDPEANPAGAVAVRASWRSVDAAPADAKRASALSDQSALATLTDSLGRWHICGAPLRTVVTLRAAGDDGFDDRTATLDDAHRAVSVDFSLRSIAAGGNSERAPQTSAVVVFSVEDRNGNVVGGVTLDIVPSNGPARRVVTDSAGRAIVASMAPGRARVNSLAIGFKPGELFVPLDVGRNTVPLILDGARIPTLATIRVIGDRTMLARHQEFEWRRAQHQATVSITADDIERRNPVETWQMLTNVPSMRVIQGAGMAGVYAMSTRETPVVQRQDGLGGGSSVPCWYRVMLDGVLLPDAQPDLSNVLPNPHEIHGIEVFAGLATIPPQYNNRITDSRGNTRSNSCGLILVWTK